MKRTDMVCLQGATVQQGGQRIYEHTHNVTSDAAEEIQGRVQIHIREGIVRADPEGYR